MSATPNGTVFNRRSQCKGKIQYNSKADAKKAIRRRQTKNGRFSHRVESYRCPHCGFFHLGSAKPTEN